MKYSLKNLLKKGLLSFITVMIIGLGLNQVLASTTNSSWAINVTSNWKGLGQQTKSSSSSKQVYINWTDAEAKDFKLNFRILNEDLKEIDNCTLNYLGSTTFTTSTVNGRTYILQAKRLYFFNPSVYCKGVWRIN